MFRDFGVALPPRRLEAPAAGVPAGQAGVQEPAPEPVPARPAGGAVQRGPAAPPRPRAQWAPQDAGL
eukprot:2452694-Alexandrium_andersonii.AAC.1